MADQPLLVDNTPFLGRVEEQKQFRIALRALLHSDPVEDSPYIILLYGDGGMGKTTLAKCFRRLAEIEQPFESEFQTLWIDWEDERNRSADLQIGREHVSPETVFRTLYMAAERNKWGRNFGTYQKTLSLRSTAEMKAVEAISKHDTADEFAPLRGSSANLLAKFIRAGIPAIGDTGEQFTQVLLDNTIRVGAHEAAKLRGALENRLKANLKKELYDILLNPHEQLAQALADGLQKTATGKPLLVFLDTYEIIDRTDAQLRLIMHEAGPRVMWIISGRTDLVKGHRTETGYFKGYADEFSRRLLTYDMRQLAIDDIRNYFRFRVPQRPLTELDVEAISRTTRGIPLAIREAADIWLSGATLASIIGNITERTPRDQIVRTMTERYLLHAVNTEDKISLYALALARGNIEILRAMLSRPEIPNSFDLDALLHRLERDYASVHAERARLHDAPAHFFREYLRIEVRRTGEPVKTLSQRAVTALQEQLSKLEENLPSIEERCDNEDWVRAVLELTYYLFWLDEYESWHWYIPRFVEGLVYNRQLCKGLLQISNAWINYISKTGQKRHAVLVRASSPAAHADDIADMLLELDRLNQKHWLDGPGREEREGILLFLHAELLNDLNRYVEALAQHKLAEQKIPNSSRRLRSLISESLSYLSLRLFEKHNRQESEESAHLAIRVDAGNAGAYHRVGHVYLDLRKGHEAVSAFNTAISLEPNDADHYQCLGLVYLQLDMYEEAASVCQTAITLSSEVAKSHGYLGSALLHLKDTDGAISEYRKAITLSQTNDDQAHFWGQLGNAYLFLKQHDEAQSCVEKAMSLSPEYAPDGHHALAHIFTDLDKIDDAIVEFREAIRLNPKDAEHYACLGMAYLQDDNIEEGTAVALRCLAIDPQSDQARTCLGDAYLRLGQTEEAIAEYETALTLDVGREGKAHDFASLGFAYLITGSSEKAKQCFQEAITTYPQSAIAHSYTGILHHMSRNFVQAANEFRYSLEIEPDDIRSHCSLAHILVLQGERSEAANELQSARQLAPKEHEYNRACLEAICGNFDEALALLKVALEKKQTSLAWVRRDPDFESLRSDPRFIALVGTADEKPTTDS